MRAITAMGLAIILGSASSGRAASECRVTGDPAHLTAHVVDTPVRLALDAMARTAGVRVLWLQDEGQEAVSVSFEGLDVARAAERLLPQRNHTIVYRAGRAVEVRIGSLRGGYATPAPEMSPEEFSPPPVTYDTGIPNDGRGAEALSQRLAAGEITSWDLVAIARANVGTPMEIEARNLLEMLAGSDPDALAALDTLGGSRVPALQPTAARRRSRSAVRRHT